MTDAPRVVLDACVLATFSVCDTLLRIAEPPSLFEAKWSADIITEAARTLETRLGWPAHLVTHFQSELLSHFSDAWATGYQALVDQMENDAKDRHVLAAAVSCGASVIVTFNLRHFQKQHLDPWGIVALHPQSFLIDMYRRESEVVMAKLRMQAADRKRSLAELLQILSASVPEFVTRVQAEYGI